MAHVNSDQEPTVTLRSGMTVSEASAGLMHSLIAGGCTVREEGGRLLVWSPDGLHPDVMYGIVAHESELLALLTSGETAP